MARFGTQGQTLDQGAIAKVLGIAVQPATAAALAAYLLRGLDCGGVAETEVTAAAGCDRARLTELAAPPSRRT